MVDLGPLLGSIDIYLLDQVLRGRIRPGMRIFDAGCGGGRNLQYFLRAGYEVRGVDEDPQAIAGARQLAAQLGAPGSEQGFRVERLQEISEAAGSADVVLSSAVLHFARDDQDFLAMLQGSWRPLRRGGLFFCRLASTIGMENRFQALGEGRYRLLDGTERYLVTEGRLVELTQQLGGRLLDPLKTTVVQDRRCMTTWVVERR
jgi:2-polyprenyl-3-methyl-5-hydroxy-6-metoxy-1,4-benzoquinol methylase